MEEEVVHKDNNKSPRKGLSVPVLPILPLHQIPSKQVNEPLTFYLEISTSKTTLFPSTLQRIFQTLEIYEENNGEEEKIISFSSFPFSFTFTEIILTKSNNLNELVDTFCSPSKRKYKKSPSIRKTRRPESHAFNLHDKQQKTLSLSDKLTRKKKKKVRTRIKISTTCPTHEPENENCCYTQMRDCCLKKLSGCCYVSPDNSPSLLLSLSEKEASLDGTLRDPLQLQNYSQFINENKSAIELIKYWGEIERFRVITNCTDKMMANNMIKKLISNYHSNPLLPGDLREKIFNFKQLTKKNFNFNESTFFIFQIQFEILKILLENYFDDYFNQKNKEEIKNNNLNNINNNNNNNDNNNNNNNLNNNNMDYRKSIDDLTFDSFEIEDSAENIRFVNVNNNQIVIAATVEKLVQRLTYDHNDSDFTFTFLLTYKYFINSSITLLKLLIKRYKLISIRSTSSDQSKSTKMKILLRIVNVIKLWIEYDLDEFKREPLLLNLAHSFTDHDVHLTLPAAAKNLRSFMINKIGINASEVKLEHIPTLEMARQLTIIDQLLFRSIRRSEVLYQNWTKEETKHFNCTNLLTMIKRFNRLGNWTVTEIVSTRDLKKRVDTLSKIIQLAYDCYKIRNYNAAMAIVSGLKNSNVTRLKQTWGMISASMWDMWEEVSEIVKIEDNFGVLRSVLKSTPLPAIPYLGMLLSDLTFNDVEPNFIDDAKTLVNFKKMRCCADVIRKMEHFTSELYYFQPVSSVQEFIIGLQNIKESEFYEQSCLCEAKRQQGEAKAVQPANPTKRRGLLSSWNRKDSN